jgi:hypothetical protein
VEISEEPAPDSAVYVIAKPVFSLATGNWPFCFDDCRDELLPKKKHPRSNGTLSGLLGW